MQLLHGAACSSKMLHAQQEEMTFLRPDFMDPLAGLGSPQLCSPSSLLVPLQLPYPGTYLSTKSLWLDPHTRVFPINSSSSLSAHSSPPIDLALQVIPLPCALPLWAGPTWELQHL